MAKGAHSAAGAPLPWALQPLTVAQRDGLSALHTLAQRYKLSSETTQQLLMLCLTMRLWPQDERAPRTLRQQQKSLEAIAAKAEELEALILSLPLGESLRFWNVPLCPPDGDPDEPDDDAPVCVGDLYPYSYRAFVRAIRQLSESFGRDPKKGGRPLAKLWQLDLVGDIARLLERDNIKPSKSKGRFMAICDACFAVIGIPAKAEGAVKGFYADFRLSATNRGP
jgi:hypothetical protein